MPRVTLLAELPPDRRAALTALRQLILANIDPAYQEGMGYGMAGYSVLRAQPAGACAEDARRNQGDDGRTGCHQDLERNAEAHDEV